ncbi:hypothetical protein LTR74_018474 [Friedmanniomyces endolithicus]|nr:hypothetical protein LTR74_018474 [Friedmanniomyces endolithicus]
MPNDEILLQSLTSFNTSFKKHLFLDKCPLHSSMEGSLVPPYLQLAFACLACALSSEPDSAQDPSDHILSSTKHSAARLCRSGMTLWGVMMEVDNREARLVEAVLAGSLFATYASLTADPAMWDSASSTLAGVGVMARRMRMQHGNPSGIAQKLWIECGPTMSSLMMSYFLVVDVVRAIHTRATPCISTRELFMHMPFGHYSFNSIYGCLISGIGTLPTALRGNDNGLLLLVAICSDLLYADLISSNLAHDIILDRIGFASGPNAYVPLAPESEAMHVRHIFKDALTRWHQHFSLTVSADVMSFFYFCRLFLAVPELLYLPSYAGYPGPALSRPGPTVACHVEEICISDEAYNFAWLILDHTTVGTITEHDNKISIWLPVALFYAAMTVWHRLKYSRTSADFRGGSLSCLKMFTAELRNFPWPCCATMTLIIEKLTNE